jgi:MoxR-like ATPase
MPDAPLSLNEVPIVASAIRDEVARRIVGLDSVIDEILIAIASNGHALLVGVPGLAKTLLVRTVAELLGLEFNRIQFTPDLMPSDITGTEVITDDETTGQREFRFLKGPVFANVLLADEINRTPPKTQAALMEAMEERQVTSIGRRYAIDPPFIVLATQNPIEQEGTYPLPAAQLDRFLLEIRLDYPDFESERRIASLVSRTGLAPIRPVLDRERFLAFAAAVRSVPVPDAVAEYALSLVRSTRPESLSATELTREWVTWGAGPRAGQALVAAARARAALSGRSEATIADVRAIALPALRHRLVLNFHAEAEAIGADEFVRRLLEERPDPNAPPPSRKASFLKRVLGSFGPAGPASN